MGLVDIVKGSEDIISFGSMALGTGFAAGFAEGKGMAIEKQYSDMLKYGPTVLATSGTFFLTAMSKYLSSMAYSRIPKYREDGSLVLNPPINKKYRYYQLSEEEKKELDPAIDKIISDSKNNLENTSYIKSIARVSVATAGLTSIGYVAGKVLSQYF